MLAAHPAAASHLFGPDSGWEKARGGDEAIRVWAQPRLKVRIRQVIGPWNRLAGRKLFKAVAAWRRADVLFRPAETTWVQCLPSYQVAYERCIIWSDTSFTPTLRHELGHALGLADHIQVVYAEGPYVNPRICDQPSAPEFSPYEGVMSYCSWDDGYRGWYGAADRKMLAEGGYAYPHAEQPIDLPQEVPPVSPEAPVEAEVLPPEDWGILLLLNVLARLFGISRDRRQAARAASRLPAIDG